MQQPPKYPIGEQSFSSLIEEGYLYVDKTRFIEPILKEGKYFFLGRPRRFGKSLFLSTLKCFFQGRRELFKGLYADTMDWDWEPTPVLHIDLNVGSYRGENRDLEDVFEMHLSYWEEDYGIDKTSGSHSTRFNAIIREVYRKTGKKVVVLVDEYDKPLVNNIDDKENFERYRNLLYGFYSNFKSCADYIRLIFLTGVSRFGKVSVFSGLNNIKDISFDDEFTDICGLTDDEIDKYFKFGIERLARTDEISYYEARNELKKHYDGYHFSKKMIDMYNPFSFLLAMDSGEILNYWIMSGRTEFVSKQISRQKIDIERLLSSRCTRETLMGIEPDSPNPLALLYQTGYLTIKDFDRRSKIFTLGLPNTEVKEGLIDNLLPYYSSLQKNESPIMAFDMTTDLENGDAAAFMQRLQSLFAGYSYEMKLENENNFHNVIYMMMLLLSVNVHTEHKTSDGRIDLLLTTDKYRYVIELKVDSTPEEALRQIDDKEYTLQFSTDHRQIIKIGANFSTDTRRLTGFVIAK